jgi:hypothetical protein
MPVAPHQNPNTPGPGSDPVYARLRNQEIGKAGMGTGMLIGGLAITLVSLLIVDAILCYILYALLRDTYLSFWGWFGVLLVLLVPYLIWMEKRTRGQFWSDAVLDSGVDWGSYTGYGGYTVQSTLGSALVYTEMLLIGPRLLIGGYVRLRGIEATQLESFLRRCAICVYDLAEHGQAVSLQKLAKPGESPARLEKLVKHLESHNWVGHSADMKRIWLSSEAKKDLVAWGLLASAR